MLLAVGFLPAVWLALSIIYCHPSSAKQSGQGWVMDRQNLMGREVVIAGQTGVRITYPELGYNIQATAPDWDITWFNTKSRKQYNRTLAQYRRASGLPKLVGGADILKKVPVVYSGLKSFKIIIAEHKAAGSITLYQSKEYLTLKESDYYISETAYLQKNAIEFLCIFYGVPDIGGIPLACHQHLSNGELKRPWFTQKIERKDLPASAFAKPTGFATTADGSMLALSGDRGRIKDIMLDMKLGEDFGGK